MTTLKLIGAAAIRLTMLAAAWTAQDATFDNSRPLDEATYLIQDKPAPDLNSLTPTIRIISLTAR
jgi:hypothetical protein